MFFKINFFKGFSIFGYLCMLGFLSMIIPSYTSFFGYGGTVLFTTIFIVAVVFMLKHENLTTKKDRWLFAVFVILGFLKIHTLFKEAGFLID